MASASSRASRARDSTAAACRDALREFNGSKSGSGSNQNEGNSRGKIGMLTAKVVSFAVKLAGYLDIRKNCWILLGFDLRKCHFNQQGLGFEQ